MNRFICLLCTVLACLGWTLAGAHEGHEHGAELESEPPAVNAAPAPTGSAATPQVEMVVSREAHDIVIYVDDYASNAPVDGLRVQVRVGDRLLQAAAAGDGIYRIPADAAAVQEETPATFLLHGSAFDLQLQSTIPKVPAAETEARAPARTRPAAWIGGAAVLAALLIFAISILRRRRAATL